MPAVLRLDRAIGPRTATLVNFLSKLELQLEPSKLELSPAISESGERLSTVVFLRFGTKSGSMKMIRRSMKPAQDHILTEASA
jgi:hypothetical protein